MKTCRAKRLLSPLAAALAVLVCAKLLNAAEFFALDRVPGEESKRVSGISADGSVIVGYSSGGDDKEAWRWTAATGLVHLAEALGDANTKTEVYSVSADGSTVFGKRVTTSGAQLFRWTQQDEFGDFVDVVLPADGINCSRTGTSADGSVVVGRTGSWHLTSVACFQTADGRFVSLGVREGFDSSSAMGVSADGSIIAGRSDTIENGWKGRTETWLWSDDGGYVDLGGALISNLSEDGSVAIGFTLPSYDEFRWTADGGMQLLGTEDNQYGPWVSRDGTLVFLGVGNPPVAGVWDGANGQRNLRDSLISEFDLANELQGWQLEYANRSSLNNRVLAGNGISPQGNDETWVAILDPPLQPGDADQDWDFDQLDLVKVQVAGKYLTGQPATWGEGDWDGAPVVLTAKPPEGDRLFNQLDIVAAQQAALYLTGPYDAEQPNAALRHSTISVGYPTDLLPKVPDTWGELGTATRVSSFQSFIVEATTGQVAIVPEPGSRILGLLGFCFALNALPRVRSTRTTSRILMQTSNNRGGIVPSADRKTRG